MSQRIGTLAVALTRVWHHVDVAADKRTLGRLAALIAATLMGKHKPTHTPNRDHGDYVVVTNCAHLKVSGNKMTEKLYWSHTSRPGSLNLIPMDRMIANKGHGEVLRRAVKGMLPKNKHRLVRMDRLKVYDGHENPYTENLVAFADEQAEVKQKMAVLEQREAKAQELRAKFSQ